jgi:hypothetical protein
LMHDGVTAGDFVGGGGEADLGGLGHERHS